MKREDRLDFYRAMSGRLCTGGILINTEISFDLNSLAAPDLQVEMELVVRLPG